MREYKTWDEMWDPIRKGIVYKFPNSLCDVFQLGSIMCDCGMLMSSQVTTKL